MNHTSKSLIKTLLGTNGAGLIHLVRAGPKQFVRSTRRACEAAWHTDSDVLHAIPCITLGEILRGRKPTIEVVVQEQEDGSMPLDQGVVLAAIARAEQPTAALEIGTYMGHTTRLLADNLNSAIIHTVDLPPDVSLNAELEKKMRKDDFHLIRRRVVGREFKGQPCESRIVQHFADTASWNFEEAAGATFFFIDGSHTYDYVKNDSEKCLQLCRGSGVFLWHDCDDTHPGVLKFLHEWRGLGRDIRRIYGTPLAYWKAAGSA